MEETTRNYARTAQTRRAAKQQPSLIEGHCAMSPLKRTSGIAFGMSALCPKLEVPALTRDVPSASESRRRQAARSGPFRADFVAESAYRRRGTAGAFLKPSIVTRWIVRATYARLY